MSQPAVSNAIKNTEASLGFLLFERVNKRLIPTQEAQILLSEAEPLFLMQEKVNQTAVHLKNGRKGRMRIVATSELSNPSCRRWSRISCKTMPGSRFRWKHNGSTTYWNMWKPASPTSALPWSRIHAARWNICRLPC